MRPDRRVQPGPGQESVWDYPRPPRIERSGRHVRIVFNGVVLADTRSAWRVLETSHPPAWYLPPEDVARELLQPTERLSHCEWKGVARYFTLVVGDRRADNVAWCYPEPTAPFAPLRDHLAFYPAPLDECTVDGEQVLPQPGGFYGGWITAEVVGPFKGEPGSWGW